MFDGSLEKQHVLINCSASIMTHQNETVQLRASEVSKADLVGINAFTDLSARMSDVDWVENDTWPASQKQKLPNFVCMQNANMFTKDAISGSVTDGGGSRA